MEAAVFILSLVDCCALIFLSVYFIITLSDLECDYINARACCSKLNKWVIPEMVGQCLSMMLMLVSFHWFIFLLNIPAAAWNIYRYVKIPMGNMGVFDPTEIHNRGLLKSYMKEAMIKLGYHLLCFFIYLYSMILALINDWSRLQSGHLYVSAVWMKYLRTQLFLCYQDPEVAIWYSYVVNI